MDILKLDYHHFHLHHKLVTETDIAGVGGSIRTVVTLTFCENMLICKNLIPTLW